MGTKLKTVPCNVCGKKVQKYESKLKLWPDTLCSLDCKKAYHRQFTGNKNPSWKGGRTTANGYVMMKSPNHPRAGKRGYVYEHILVAEQKLGRPVEKGEIIHHLDGDIKNNSEDNVVVLESQKEHSKYHIWGRYANVNA